MKVEKKNEKDEVRKEVEKSKGKKEGRPESRKVRKEKRRQRGGNGPESKLVPILDVKSPRHRHIWRHPVNVGQKKNGMYGIEFASTDVIVVVVLSARKF